MSDYKSAIAGLSFRAVYFTDFNAHDMPEGGSAPWDLSMAGDTPDLPKVGRRQRAIPTFRNERGCRMHNRRGSALRKELVATCLAAGVPLSQRLAEPESRGA